MPWIVERVRSPTGRVHRSTTKISKVEHRHSTASRRDYLKFAKTTCPADCSVAGLVTHPMALETNKSQNDCKHGRRSSIQGIASSMEYLTQDNRILNIHSHKQEFSGDTGDANGWYRDDAENIREVRSGVNGAALSSLEKCDHQICVPQINHGYQSSSSSWTMKKGPKRAVSWMSPIKTVSSFDSSTFPVTLSSTRLASALESVCQQNVTRTSSTTVQNVFYRADEVNSTTMEISRYEDTPQNPATMPAPEDDLPSPIGIMQPVSTKEIWRRDPGKQLALNIGVQHEASPADDDDELMCITFTPSDDAEDFFRCDSPVAVDPEDIEQGLVQNHDAFASHSYPTKRSHVTPDHWISQQKNKTFFTNLLTFLLAIACFSGHSVRVLSRYDVPERIFSFMRPEIEVRTTLRRKYNESARDVFRSPGIFLDTRQNMVGVWLK